jgi:hypothetical protein
VLLVKAAIEACANCPEFATVSRFYTYCLRFVHWL